MNIIKKPNWIKIKFNANNKNYFKISNFVKKFNLNTVCQEAKCPNIIQCWQKKHIAFMILGTICTRTCKFCNVKRGFLKNKKVDISESDKIAFAVKELDIKYVVITSVNRDDLEDGGAKHFAECISKIRELVSREIIIEVLTPDFFNKKNAIETIVNAKPNIFNHNIETVPSLYKIIKPGSRYSHSLNILYKVKSLNKNIFTKSGFMLGFDEKDNEVLQIMDDLRNMKVDFLTIGQYLQPSKNHLKVKHYVTPEKFLFYKKVAKIKGFLIVLSNPLVRSSYLSYYKMLKKYIK